MKLDSKKVSADFRKEVCGDFSFLAEQFIQSLQKTYGLPLIFRLPIETVPQIPPYSIGFGESEISGSERTVFVRQVFHGFSYL